MANTPAMNPAAALGDATRFGDIRKRLAFLIGALVVYRIGTFIPVPGIDTAQVAAFFLGQEGTILGVVNMFSGGALERMSIFAMGVMPYISASIIMQMMSMVVPSLMELRKEGESGRRKITQMTRYATVVLAVFQSFAAAATLQGNNMVLSPGFFQWLFPKIMHGWSAAPEPFSVAIWVGYIAAFGMATETGIIMLVYLREAIDKRGGLENIKSLDELRQAVIEGAVHRLRPKLLTEGVAIIAIFPMVFAKGVGGEILAPMALPVLGGLLISDEVVDLFLPVRFYWVRRARWLRMHNRHPDEQHANHADRTPEPLSHAVSA